MKNSVLIVLCVALSYITFGQKTVSIIDGERLEVRIIPLQGISYRLSPDMPFEATGMFNRNLKPYFKEYDESFLNYKKHRRSYLGMTGSSVLYTAGTMTTFIGFLYNGENVIKIGGGAAVMGIGLMVLNNHRNMTSLRDAIDAYNRNKYGQLADVQYLEVFPHAITTWQYRTNPSENYQSIGFLGKNIKPHFENDEAAYAAFQKYKTGHIMTKTANLAALTGVSMIVVGIASNNVELARAGLYTDIGGLALLFVGNSMMVKNLMSAVDLSNYQQAPLIKSSFVPSIQPSSYSAGLGLVWDIR